MSWLRRERNESGIAIITVLLMMGVIAALSATVTVVSINNASNSNADRQAGAALGVSEAGISQALSYLNLNGVGGVAAICATANSYCNPSSPKVIIVSPTEKYSVYVKAIQVVNVAAKTPGVYRIVSTGTNGTNPGTRTVQVDVTVKPFKFPIGVFAHAIDLGGNPSLHKESIFSDGCITNRSKINFGGAIDAFFGIPAAAHSSKFITDSNNGCSASDNKNIHGGGVKCDTQFPYDQDSLGGPLTSGDGCYGAYAGTYPFTSFIDAATIYTTYDFQPPGLTPAQLDALRAVSQSQGYYYTNTNVIPAALRLPDAHVTTPYPVLFYDLKGSSIGQTVDLSDLTGYGNDGTRQLSPAVAATDAACKAYGAIVIVKQGNVKLNSNTTLVANVFAFGTGGINGNITKANGNAALLGTVYATGTIDMTGTVDVFLDNCFLQNLPGPLLDRSLSNFVELDR